MLPLILTIVVFVTIVMVVFFFGAAVVTPSSVLGARLRALGGQQQTSEAKARTQGSDRTGYRPA